MARHRAVGRVGKPPLAQTCLGSIGPCARIALRKEAIQHQPLDLVARQGCGLCSGDQAGPPARQRHREPLVRRSDARKGLLLQIATRRDEVIPLRAGNLAAFPHKPRFKQDREGEIDVVAAQQNVFADGNPLDVGDDARRTGSQLEQAEIRGATANIDDQDVLRLGIVRRQSLPTMGRSQPCCSSQQ